MSDAHYWTADQARAAVATGEVSSLELTEAALARIDGHDSELNAVCVRLDERARDAARRADRAIASGEDLGPLHGVPMTVKEAWDIVDTPSTWGREDRADHRATENATVIDRLDAAGAIIVGKTNVPEHLADWQSNNAVYGRVRNPWDTDRTPGGSSGGSAVSLAAGYAYLESGSDIGGSLRNPAHYCGVAAHKPTHGVVPMTGHALDNNLRHTDISVTGPMGRTMADVRRCFDVIAGFDGPTATGMTLSLPAPRTPSLNGARIAMVTEETVCHVASDVQASVRSAADAAEAAGATVVRDVDLPVDTRHSHDVYIRLLRAVGAADLAADRFAELHVEAGGDPTRWQTRVAAAMTQTHGDWLRADKQRSDLRRAWASFFEDFDVLLCPVAPTVAWEHDDLDRFDRVIQIDKGGTGRDALAENSTTIGYYEQLFWAGINNVALLPASVIAGCQSSDGLPIGLQLIGPYLEDHTCMQLADSLEAELVAAGTGGFRPPPMFA